jgi:transposase
MMVRPVEHRTVGQIAFLEQIVSHDPLVATAYTLTQEFGQLLQKREGKSRLEDWKAEVRSSGITELIHFVDGLADDEAAVTNACTEPWSNGMVEGFNQKVKLIKRSSYGQAGFPLLQRRVLLHPAPQDPFDKDQKRPSSRSAVSPDSHKTSDTGSFPTVLRETRIA